MVTCPYCTETPFRLGPFGPCVCATPEALLVALTAARADRDDIERQLLDAREETDDLTEQVAHRDERLNEAWDEVRKNPDVNGPDKQSLAKATEQALDLAYAQGAEGLAQAGDALRRYLIGQGLPGAPLRLADPDLDALADALL